jgi:hypothetical protein
MFALISGYGFGCWPLEFSHSRQSRRCSFSVSPPLPAGLQIDTASGNLSGTPGALAPLADYTITASNAGGANSFVLSLAVGPGPVVHLSGAATDPNGLPLTYLWHTTDGTLVNVNGAEADWLMTSGPGEHFAYLIVGNGSGGYAEQRVAVNTDTSGTSILQQPPINVLTPVGPARQGDFYRSSILAGMTATPYFNAAGANPSGHLVVVAGAGVNIYSNPVFTAVSPTVTTDLRGEFLIPGLPVGTNYAVNCNAGPLLGNVNCTSPSGGDLPGLGTFTMLPVAINDWYPGGQHSYQTWPWVVGSLRLADGSPCGINEPFFGVRSSGQALYADSTGAPLFNTDPALGLAWTQYGPVVVNEFMDYALPGAGVPAPANTAPFVKLSCENAPPIVMPVPAGLGTGISDVGLATVNGVARPVITSIVASDATGVPIASFVAPSTPPAPVPSDINPRSTAFLAFKGIDSRLGACLYYRAVGAVQSCDAKGVPTGAVTFDDWMRAAKIGPYALPGTPEYTASYVNKMDLNLTRNHHSISYGAGQTAAYVCNHFGPAFNNPTQADIDQVIDNALKNVNRVACVAMDYTVTPGVNLDTSGVPQPFTRFLIFGPSGELLQSVNLDGRGEKFVPGTCVACHGGDHYTGHYPDDGSGVADIGAHFLPYDAGNFVFSSKPGLTLADQQEAIYQLNQNLLNAGPTLAEQELIAGWYAGGTHQLDLNYVPASWQAGTPAQVNYYRNIGAHYCRSCHVALTEGYNFDHLQNYRLPNGTYRSNGTYGFLATASAQCGPSFYGLPSQEFSMPNSLVTFNRFWQLFGNDPTVAANRAACYAAVEVQ